MQIPIRIAKKKPLLPLFFELLLRLFAMAIEPLLLWFSTLLHRPLADSFEAQRPLREDGFSGESVREADSPELSGLRP